MPLFRVWAKGGVKRLYVTGDDGSGLGYVDLETQAAVPDDAASPEDLRIALASLAAKVPGADSTPLPGITRTIEPFTDLADNLPGSSIAALDGPGFAAGVAAEHRTAAIMERLAQRYGWKVLHSIPLSDTKDLDHLLITHRRVWAINTKTTSYRVEAIGESVRVDGHAKEWVPSIERDASVTSEVLSKALRFECRVWPLVVVWSSQPSKIDTRFVLPGSEVARSFSDHAALDTLHGAAWIDVVHAAARRSDVWETFTPR